MIKTNQPQGREVHLDFYAADPVARLEPTLFLKQRELLIELFEKGIKYGFNQEQLVLLEGIVSFLDCIADYAHDAHGIYGCLFFDDEPCCNAHVAEFIAEKQNRDRSSPLVS